MPRRSIGFPLTIGIVLTVLAAALAVGWQILVVADLRPVARGLTAVHWTLLILGGVFFGLLILGLVLLCAWLVREMRFSQRQQAFLDTVTHEMKTPLASLRLYLDTLESRDPDPQRRQEFVARMRADLERLHRTVDQVLAAARAEERGRPHRERVDLGVLLERCIEEVRRRHGLPADAISFERRGAGVVWGDATEFELVFQNLLDNAVKYSQVPAGIRVRVQGRPGEKVSVEIADRGIGIPPRELRKIFRRFYRTGRDTQRKAAGLGLGLFIVRNLVLRHGGRVVARSEGVGRGSRFAVTLPAAASEREPGRYWREGDARQPHPGR